LLVATSTSILPGRFSETAEASPAQRFGQDAQAEFQDRQEAIAAGDDARTVLLVGDSVALTLGLNYDPSLGAPDMAVPTEAHLGCGLIRGEIYSDGAYRHVDPICDDWPALWEQAIAEDDPDASVLLVGAWEVFDRRVDGQELKFGTPEFDAYFRSEFERAIRILTADGRPAIVLTPPCFAPTESIFGWGSERTDPDRVAWVADRIREFAADASEIADVRLLDLRSRVCDVEAAKAALGGADLQYDGVHFSDAGAQWVWRWLAPQVSSIAGQAQLAANGPISGNLGPSSG
jgi:hypothetical protein